MSEKNNKVVGYTDNVAVDQLQRVCIRSPCFVSFSLRIPLVTSSNRSHLRVNPLFCVFQSVNTFFFLIKIGCRIYKFRLSRAPERTNETKLPGVSILKPLKGVDDNLIENLCTFFQIDYPKYEILFCVQDATDPAVEVVRQLLNRFPHVDAKLFSGIFLKN